MPCDPCSACCSRYVAGWTRASSIAGALAVFCACSVLAALVMPDLVLVGGNLELSFDNLFFIASFPTLTVCWYKKGSLFSALAVGMGTIALIRYWIG